MTNHFIIQMLKMNVPNYVDSFYTKRGEYFMNEWEVNSSEDLFQDKRDSRIIKYINDLAVEFGDLDEKPLEGLLEGFYGLSLPQFIGCSTWEHDFSRGTGNNDMAKIGFKVYTFRVLKAAEIIMRFNPPVESKSAVSLWDIGGQEKYDRVKPDYMKGAYYSLIFQALNDIDQKRAEEHYQMLKQVVPKGHTSQLVFSFLDERMNDLNYAFDEIRDDLTFGGLLANLQSLSDGRIPFSGVTISSARPCLGFYNCNIDLVRLKYMYDYPDDFVNILLKVLLIGGGAYGKTSFEKYNLFFEENIKNWFHIGETPFLDVNELQRKIPIRKQRFYAGWCGNYTLKNEMFKQVSDDTFFLDINKVGLMISTINPMLFDMTTEYEETPMIFFPNKKALEYRLNSWKQYARQKIQHATNPERFHQFFGIPVSYLLKQKRNHKVIRMREHLPNPEADKKVSITSPQQFIIREVSDAIALPVRTVGPRLEELLSQATIV